MVAGKGWDARQLKTRESVVNEHWLKGIAAWDETERWAATQSRRLMHC